MKLTWKILSGLYLGRDIGWSWCDLDMNFDLGVVTFTIKILSVDVKSHGVTSI